MKKGTYLCCYKYIIEIKDCFFNSAKKEIVLLLWCSVNNIVLKWVLSWRRQKPWTVLKKEKTEHNEKQKRNANNREIKEIKQKLLNLINKYRQRFSKQDHDLYLPSIKSWNLPQANEPESHLSILVWMDTRTKNWKKIGCSLVFSRLKKVRGGWHTS